MRKVTVLGGCGGIGSVAVRTLASGEYFDEISIADGRLDEARALADRLGPGRLSAVELDAGNPESLKTVITGSSLVVNCIGPFYTFGPPILKAAIECGVDYVDVCDDLDATEEMLALDAAAKAAGVSALIGMGNSPGMANLFARFASEALLSEVDSIDIYHVHGGEPAEGAAVVKHRIHAMTSDIPVFMDGEFITVRMLEESGQALVEDVDFKDIGTFPVYPYPHPETITLPKYIEGVKRVSNKGFVLPAEYFRLTMDTVRLGVCTEEPLVVRGVEVVPVEFAVAFILSERPRLLEEAGLEGPMGCLKVVAGGRKDGEPLTYSFSMSSRGAGAGEGTGIPAALGAVLMSRGRVSGQGVFPPEAGVSPRDMIGLAGEVLEKIDVGTGGGVPLVLERIDAQGRTETIEM